MMGESANFSGIDTWLNVNLGDTRLQIADRVVHTLATSGAPVVIEVIGENNSFFGSESAEWEASLFGSQR